MLAHTQLYFIAKSLDQQFADEFSQKYNKQHGRPHTFHMQSLLQEVNTVNLPANKGKQSWSDGDGNNNQ